VYTSFGLAASVAFLFSGPEEQDKENIKGTIIKEKDKSFIGLWFIKIIPLYLKNEGMEKFLIPLLNVSYLHVFNTS
jgi:hypothetical protein